MARIPPDPPSRGLNDKVAIVTGSGCLGDSINNGRAVAIMLAEEGCHVLCVDSKQEWAQRTASMLWWKPGRGRAIALRGDSTKAEFCESAVQTALLHFGRLDVLINSIRMAGIGVESDMDAWKRRIETNISSMVQMANSCAPAMQKNEGDFKGSIINIGTMPGLKGGTPQILYPTAKAAVVDMTTALAAHLATNGIRVNCVCPGMMSMPMMFTKGTMSDESYDVRRKISLLGDNGSSWSTAGPAAFLASDHARWITGTTIPVDVGSTSGVDDEESYRSSYGFGLRGPPQLRKQHQSPRRARGGYVTQHWEFPPLRGDPASHVVTAIPQGKRRHCRYCAYLRAQGREKHVRYTGRECIVCDNSALCTAHFGIWHSPEERVVPPRQQPAPPSPPTPPEAEFGVWKVRNGRTVNRRSRRVVPAEGVEGLAEAVEESGEGIENSAEEVLEETRSPV